MTTTPFTTQVIKLLQEREELLKMAQTKIETKEKKAGVGYTFLSFRYGVCIGFETMMVTLISSFWAVYLSGTAGLDNVLMASVLSITALIDTISLPFLGIFMQKIRWFGGKYGMFRPWLTIASIFTALFFVLRFTQPGSITGLPQALWFGISAVLYNIGFNCAYTAYNGALPLLAPTPDERTTFSAMRNICNSAGKFLFSLIAVSSIALLGGGSDLQGYFLFAIALGLCCPPAFIQVAAALKEKDTLKTLEDQKQNESKGKKGDQYDVPFWTMLRYTISKPCLLFIGAGLLRNGMYFIMTGLAAYYYTYVVGDSAMLTAYLSSTTALMILGSLIAPLVGKYVKGYRNLYALGCSIYTICMAIACFVGQSDAFMMTVIMAAGYIGYAFCHSVEIAFYSSVVDYSSVRAGRDLKPFMMMLFSLIPKFSITIGSAVIGFGLVAIGFDANAFTPEMGASLLFLFSGLPAALGAAAVILTLLNPMNKAKCDEIAEQLEKSNLM